MQLLSATFCEIPCIKKKTGVAYYLIDYNISHDKRNRQGTPGDSLIISPVAVMQY